MGPQRLRTLAASRVVGDVEAALFIFLLVALVGMTRLARAHGVVRTAQRCEVCHRHEPSATVRFFRNTGMIVMFRWETLGAQACRSCALDAFLRMTAWTLVLGWWGLISFFINFAFIAINLASAAWALTLPSAAVAARSRLEDQREYALNLLATKDFDTVTFVLGKVTGAPKQSIESYLRTLRPDLYGLTRSS